MNDFDFSFRFFWFMFLGVMAYAAVLDVIERKGFFMLSSFLTAVFFTIWVQLVFDEEDEEYEDEDYEEMFQEVEE